MTFSRQTLGRMMEIREIWRGMFKFRCEAMTIECDTRIRQILKCFVQFGHEENYFNDTQVDWQLFLIQMDAYLPEIQLLPDISMVQQVQE